MSFKSWHSTQSVWMLVGHDSGDVNFKVYDSKGAAKRAGRGSKSIVVELSVWKEGRGDG